MEEGTRKTQDPKAHLGVTSYGEHPLFAEYYRHVTTDEDRIHWTFYSSPRQLPRKTNRQRFGKVLNTDGETWREECVCVDATDQEELEHDFEMIPFE